MKENNYLKKREESLWLWFEDDSFLYTFGIRAWIFLRFHVWSGITPCPMVGDGRVAKYG